MPTHIIAALIASSVIALISLVGRFTLLGASHLRMRSAYAYLLPISIGAFFAITFLDLIPEAFQQTKFAGMSVALGFFAFFLLSQILHEYHHHHGDDCEHTAPHAERGALVLIGNALHIFTDGVIIASAFSVDITLGIVTTLSIMLHEIPRQVAEITILLSAGYSQKKALVRNFISSLAVILGTITGIFFITQVSHALGIILGVAGGNLLYVAASDLLPSLAKNKTAHSRTYFPFLLVLGGFFGIATLLSLS